MSDQSPFIAPPRLARWLIGLFTIDEQSETLQGDLLEEFTEVSRKSGAARARHWYWRQSIKTTAHLVLSGFRAAPWSISACAIAGYFLLIYATGLPGRVATAYIASRPVIPYVDPTGPVWLLIRLCGIVIMPTIVGCLIALVSKRKEIIAILPPALLCTAQFIAFAVDLQVRLSRFMGTPFAFGPLPIVVDIFNFLIFPLLGAALIRWYRARSSCSLSRT
ncbi:MAG TPA: permease prefix domain 2-containing transporter [Candidatus Acidoferrales bacterium]